MHPINARDDLPRPAPTSLRQFRIKRHLWLLSVLFPLFPLAAVAMHFQTGWFGWLLAPLVLVYLIVPLLDALLGEDASNPPDSSLSLLAGQRYYRCLTWVAVPLHVASLLGACAYVGLGYVGPAGGLVLALVTGLASGLAVNTAHEMGHHRHPVDQWLARIALAVPVYGHFTVEHNFGHHRQVATPQDCASARFGETVYRFALREIPGGMRRAWRIESARLARRGQPALSVHNTILQSHAWALLLQGGLILAFGWPALAFLLIHNAVAWFQLTSANYVEHYGLLRERRSDGSYERCQPHHSWNSNHLVSNLLLFHLQRHSDHHAHPGLRYQCLRDFPDLPRLPSGYFGMFLLAYLPPLWFRVMNPRLLRLPHVDGDVGRINRGDRANQRARSQIS